MVLFDMVSIALYSDYQIYNLLLSHCRIALLYTIEWLMARINAGQREFVATGIQNILDYNDEEIPNERSSHSAFRRIAIGRQI
jgi:hypothetical protein